MNPSTASSSRTRLSEEVHDQADSPASKRRRMPSEQSDAHSGSSRAAVEVVLYVQPKQEDDQSDRCNTPEPQASSPLSDVDSLQDAAASNADQTRWASHEFDDIASSTPSPSPALEHFDDREYTPQGRAASSSAVTRLQASSSSGAAINRLAQDTGSAATSSALFAERKPGQLWNAEQECAFVDYLAQDSVLRRWAKEKTFGGAMEGLQRFSELTQGPSSRRLSAKVSWFRSTYSEFIIKLTPSGRSTRTSEWSQAHNAKDLSWLVSFEHRNAWIKTWHDRIQLNHSDEAKAVGPQINPAQTSAVASRASTSALDAAQVAGPSNAQSALPVQPKLETRPNQAPIPREATALSFAPAASSSVVASSSSQASAPNVPEARTQVQPAGIQARLEHQAQQIQLLRDQSHEQTHLLAQQAAQISQQASTLGRVEQQLQSLFAFIRERM